MIDIAIVGIIFALILLIVFFSAVVLYLAFRIKETFRKETRRGATLAKIAFLIGILFMAGGIFYFFANTLTNISEQAPSESPTPTPSPTPAPSPALILSVTYPTTIRMRSQLTMSITIINPTNSTIHGAAIQTNLLFQVFAVQSSTDPVVGNVLNIGDVPSGTTIVSLELLAPDRPQEFNDTVTLVYQEMVTPITQDIIISVRGN